MTCYRCPDASMRAKAIDGVRAHCADCNQPTADHINGCPTYPPLGTPGVTCPSGVPGTSNDQQEQPR